MELLREVYSPSENKLIVEEVQGKMYLSGIFCQGNVRNRNNRVYDLRNLTEQVNQLEARIKGGESIFGELDHPNSLVTNLDRVAIGLVSLTMHDTNGIGKAMILDTPCGNICKGILKSGFKLGVSTRGVGTPQADGTVNDFILHTIDVVANPSAPDAYPDVVTESYNNSKILTLAEATQYDNNAQKFLNKEIMNFIKKCFEKG